MSNVTGFRVSPERRGNFQAESVLTPRVRTPHDVTNLCAYNGARAGMAAEYLAVANHEWICMGINDKGENLCGSWVRFPNFSTPQY
jgi:hypothetical protein